MTLEQLLIKNACEFGSEGSQYIIRVMSILPEGGLLIYVRPQDRDGDTTTYILNGNDLKIYTGL